MIYIIYAYNYAIQSSFIPLFRLPLLLILSYKNTSQLNAAQYNASRRAMPRDNS